jgi:hypothetical protein
MQQALLQQQSSCHHAAFRNSRQARLGLFKHAVARKDKQRQTRTTITNSAGNSTASPVTEPTERVLKLWREANAVCFDVDCKFTQRLPQQQQLCSCRPSQLSQIAVQFTWAQQLCSAGEVPMLLPLLNHSMDR